LKIKLTRREALKMGVAAGASLLISGRSIAAQTSGLIQRAIPSSGERVPVIGLGARNYRVGDAQAERAPFKATLKAFADLGGKLVDTAPGYGNSEAVVGDLVADLGIRDQLFVATKVDREDRDEGLKRIDDSFRYLRTDRLDLMQVHNLRGVDTQLGTLRDLKAQGRIRYLGITTSSDRQYPRMIEILEREILDFIQVDYALDNRNVADRILPLAADRGMAVLVNLPFGRGRLFRAVGQRPLPDWAAEIDCSTWAQVFLKYVVSHPAITCVIPGTTKEHHAVDNQGAGRGRLPDAVLRRTMEVFIDGLNEG
jgi:aryl-alcohol dehydrogenase-like predicted oxidoreductase